MSAEWPKRYSELLQSVRTPKYKAAKRRALAAADLPDDWKNKIRVAQQMHRARPRAVPDRETVEVLTAHVQKLQAAVAALEQRCQIVIDQNTYLRRQLAAGPGASVDMAPWSELECPIRI